MMLRRRPLTYAPPPAEVLSRAELQALYNFRCRWGAILRTREPAEGNTFVRFFAVRVPLIEAVGRATYRRLEFAAWLRAHGRLN